MIYFLESESEGRILGAVPKNHLSTLFRIRENLGELHFPIRKARPFLQKVLH